MKKNVNFLFASLAFFVTSNCFAGGMTGNGGGGVVCRSDNGKIVSVRLLDLWEATVLRNIEIAYSNHESIEQQVDKFWTTLKSLNPSYYAELDKTLNKFTKLVLENPQYIGERLFIPPPFDARNGLMEKGCKLEGIALYDHLSDQLLLDRSLFSKLEKTDVAALIVHETVYYGLRKHLGVEDSVAARQITSCSASLDPRKYEICRTLDPKYNLTLDKKTKCTFGSSEAIALNNGSAKLYLSKIDGMDVPFQIKLEADHFELYDNFDSPSDPWVEFRLIKFHVHGDRFYTYYADTLFHFDRKFELSAEDEGGNGSGYYKPTRINRQKINCYNTRPPSTPG